MTTATPSLNHAAQPYHTLPRSSGAASETEVDIMTLDPEAGGFSSDEEDASGRPRPLTHLPVRILAQAATPTPAPPAPDAAPAPEPAR